MRAILLTAVFLLWSPSMSHAIVTDQQLLERLRVMGHRNWIVVADMAYPQQSNPAIETIYIGGEQIDVVERVLELVDEAPHVRARIMLDAELKAVPEKEAEGIKAYRDELEKLLEKRPVERVSHEEIISQLDKSAELFNVLILKTDMTLPYTSVFLQLECGYWSEESEAKLRTELQKKQTE